MNLDITSYLLGMSTKVATSESDLSDATATRADILYPKTAYLGNGRKGVGTIQSLDATTYTPSTIDQTITSGQYLAGVQTIKGDANLIADNIKKNISIFGVTGTYSNDLDPTRTVQLIDYDGSVLYAYTPQEFAALDSLPPLPSPTGLTAEGWNWTLADAKVYVAAGNAISLSPIYSPTSGATEIDITLTSPNLSPYLIITKTKVVTIDWGDGTTPQENTATGRQAIQHTYAQAGNYTIKLSGEDAGFTFICDDNSHAGVFSYKNVSTSSEIYSSAITAIRLGTNAIIGAAAFARCPYLKTVTIPEGITSIGQNAFTHCTSLESISIPSSVTEIKASAFYNCGSLKTVSLAKGLTTIEADAFENCISLKEISLPTTLTSLGQAAFSRCPFESIILPNSITTLGTLIFSDCDKLISATLPNAITIIPSKMFQNCRRLKTIVIPATVTTIKSDAFYNCYALENITIPALVTTIEASAFCNCFTMSIIHFLSSTPPVATSSNTFYAFPTNCIIYVPTGSLSTYTSATNYPPSATYTYMEE